MGEAIHRALRIPPIEQKARMRLMRDLVRQRNVYRWAGEMLLDAAKLQQHARIAQLVAPENRSQIKAA